MGKKQVTAHYAHLRKIILRAKLDARRAAEGKEALLLRGIRPQRADEVEIYERYYEKFCKATNISKEEENKEPKPQETVKDSASYQLMRIANALEEIVRLLKDQKKS